MGFGQVDCVLTIPSPGFSLSMKATPFKGRAEIVFSIEFSLVAFTKRFSPFWDLFFLHMEVVMLLLLSLRLEACFSL